MIVKELIQEDAQPQPAELYPQLLPVRMRIIIVPGEPSHNRTQIQEGLLITTTPVTVDHAPGIPVEQPIAAGLRVRSIPVAAHPADHSVAVVAAPEAEAAAVVVQVEADHPHPDPDQDLLAGITK